MTQEEVERNRDVLLKPSAALSRFNPAQGMITGLRPMLRQRVRYGYRMGDFGFLIGMDTVSEIVEEATIYQIPKTPPWLVGCINLRGHLVPVFDLMRCLGIEKPTRERRYLLVLDTGDDAVGVFVEKLPHPVNMNRQMDHSPPLPAALRNYATAVYSQDKIIWVEFDYRKFFQSLATGVH